MLGRGARGTPLQSARVITPTLLFPGASLLLAMLEPAPGAQAVPAHAPSHAPSAHGALTFALDLLVILAAAAVMGQIFRRFRLVTIPGYLLGGFLAGPVLGLVSNPESVDQISSLATMILMFGIGLSLDVSSLRRGMVPILVAGAVSTLIVVLLLWPTGLAFGATAPAALVIAMALSMSSTAVALRLLGERRELGRLHGRLALGISIVQDLSAVVFMALIPPIAAWAGVMAAPGTMMSDASAGAAMAGAGAAGDVASAMQGGGGLLPLITTGIVGIGGVTLLVLVGRYVLPRVLSEVARGSDAELVLVAAAAVALGSAILCAVLGFSPEMGAFLAGFLLASTPFKHHLTGQLTPIRDLLMAVFFTAIGLKVMPGAVVEGWWQVLLGLAVVVALKGVVIGFTCWATGASVSAATLTGVYLAQAGEFSLVVLAAASTAGIVPAEANAQVIATIILSLVVSPLLVPFGHRVARGWSRRGAAPWIKRWAMVDTPEGSAGVSPGPGAEASGARPGADGHGAEAAGPGDGDVPVPALPRHVVVAGFGPVGRTLAERFVKRGVPVVIIELNPGTVRRQSSMGRRIVYGDVTNPDVLESAGVREADAIILSIPDEDAAMRACPVIRRMNPGIFIAARTNYLSQAMAVQGAGADHVVVEEMATALTMEREVLARLEYRRSAQQRAANAAPSAPA
jgi:CPA2 family monovalent cation:H+ antiporter-2